MRWNMKIKYGDHKGNFISCDVCGNISYKKVAKNEYTCTYCGSNYIVDDEFLKNVDIVKHTLGKFSYKNKII